MTNKVFRLCANPTLQWALAYWPSLRNLVSGFGSIAGDFFGKLSIRLHHQRIKCR